MFFTHNKESHTEALWNPFKKSQKLNKKCLNTSECTPCPKKQETTFSVERKQGQTKKKTRQNQKQKGKEFQNSGFSASMHSGNQGRTQSFTNKRVFYQATNGGQKKNKSLFLDPNKKNQVENGMWLEKDARRLST